MNTLGSLEIHRRTINGPVGTWTVDISDLDFTSGDDYEVWPLCGHGYIECNDPTASPPINVKSATSVRVVTLTTQVTIGIFPLVGRSKKVVG